MIFRALARPVLEGLGIEAPLSTRQWADRYRVVKGGPVADESGGTCRWRTDVAPHAAGIMDAVDDDRYASVAVEGPTRLGKSEAAIINPLLKRIHQGLSVLYINQSSRDCVNVWQDKILPAIQATPELARWDKGDKDGGQMMHRIFANGAILYMSGAGAIPAGFDAPVVFCDEINKPGYDRKKGTEVNTLQLARERADGYERGRTLVMVCTVTTPDGRITNAFLSGDRRLYYVPCPHCGGYQVMEFREEHRSFGAAERYPNWDYPHGWLMFDEDDPVKAAETVRYVCGLCGKEIDEKHKAWMVRAGVWVRKGCSVEVAKVTKRKPAPESAAVHRRPFPKSKLPPRFCAVETGTPDRVTTRASFHFNALVGLFTSWGRLAQDYVEARADDDPDSLKSFQRSRLAIPWADQEVMDKREWDSQFVRSHATPYAARTLPTECPADAVVLLTADVHKSAIYYVFRAWAMDGTSWLLEAGVIAVHLFEGAGDHETHLAVWNALQRLHEAFEQGFEANGGRRIVPVRALVDEGWETETVRAWCREHRGIWLPVKGAPGLDKPWRKRQKEAAASWLLAVDRYKHQLSRLMAIPRTVEGGEENAPPGYWHLHQEPHHDYCHQMCSEKWQPKKNRDGADADEYEWAQIKISNHWWDCEVYQVAGAHLHKVPVHRIGRPGAAASPARRSGPMGEPRKPTAADYGNNRIGRGGRDESTGRDGFRIGR